jgi:hypothetical protein
LLMPPLGGQPVGGWDGLDLRERSLQSADRCVK